MTCMVLAPLRLLPGQGQYVVDGGVKKRQGKGTFTDGAETYVGEWKDDDMHGAGTFTFASGAVFEGNFVGNEFSGAGTYKFTDGATYEGAWKQNKMHGKGVYVDAE